MQRVKWVLFAIIGAALLPVMQAQASTGTMTAWIPVVHVQAYSVNKRIQDRGPSGMNATFPITDAKFVSKVAFYDMSDYGFILAPKGWMGITRIGNPWVDNGTQSLRVHDPRNPRENLYVFSAFSGSGHPVKTDIAKFFPGTAREMGYPDLASWMTGIYGYSLRPISSRETFFERQKNGVSSYGFFRWDHANVAAAGYSDVEELFNYQGNAPLIKFCVQYFREHSGEYMTDGSNAW